MYFLHILQLRDEEELECWPAWFVSGGREVPW